MIRSFTPLIFSFLTFFSYHAFAQSDGYKIDITIKGWSDTTVILAHYMGKSMYPDDTTYLDAKGHGVFKGSKTLTEGLYVIFPPDGAYFEFIMGADQNFGLSTDTTQYLKNLKPVGSEDNDIFIDFQKYMLEKREKMDVLQESYNKASDDKEKEKIVEKMRSLDKERIEKVEKIVSNHPELFVSTFLNATTDIEVPQDIQDDQQASYEYYKNHYFDHFDISDRRLIYTPLYEDKVMRYLDKIVPQIPDSLIQEVDWMIRKVKSDSVAFQFLMPKLFNKYAKSNLMGMDAVLVHIAHYYITDAWWSSDDFIKDLKERIEKIEPLLLGKKAPDVQLRLVPSEHFKQAEHDTALKKYPHAGKFFKISDIDADFTVLVFWEAHCSHCKKVIPKLHSIYEDTLKSMNVKIVAISTLFGEDGKVDWVDFVNSKKLYDWINAWNPYDYKFKEIYDIRSTPQIFVLNKDKEIIGKKLGPENVVELIEAYKKMEGIE